MVCSLIIVLYVADDSGNAKQYVHSSLKYLIFCHLRCIRKSDSSSLFIPILHSLLLHCPLSDHTSSLEFFSPRLSDFLSSFYLIGRVIQFGVKKKKKL